MRKEEFFLFNDTLNTFYYAYMVSDMVKDHFDREEINCHHYMGYSFQIAARYLLYAPSHRQDSTYHNLCYISDGVLAGMRNSSIVPP